MMNRNSSDNLSVPGAEGEGAVQVARHYLYPGTLRITSYNVCYTKLLRDFERDIHSIRTRERIEDRPEFPEFID